MSLFESASLVVTPNGTKASKLYAIKPTSGAGDLTVVRATTATRVNSAGLIESVAVNVPRLDYLNSTCPSILIEPQRTNLQIQSEDFTNLIWFKYNTTVSSNSTTAPDGNTTADKLIPNTSTDNHAVVPSSLIIINSLATVTIYAKAAGYNFIGLSDAVTGQAVFNLSNGTIVSQDASITASTPVNMGNGWYRLQITFNATTPRGIGIDIWSDANKTIFAGNGTSGIYVWGAQLENASYATSYIPTVASAVTRNADVISKTGISSLIGTEFTFFLDAYETTGGNTTRYSALKGSGSTYENLLIIEANASNQIAVNLIGVFYGIIVPLVSGERFKLAVRCKNNDFAFYWNGNLVQSQSSGTVPVLSDLYLGYYTDYADNFNKINSSAIWKTGLTNAELAELTTI